MIHVVKGFRGGRPEQRGSDTSKDNNRHTQNGSFVPVNHYGFMCVLAGHIMI